VFVTFVRVGIHKPTTRNDGGKLFAHTHPCYFPVVSLPKVRHINYSPRAREVSEASRAMYFFFLFPVSQSRRITRSRACRGAFVQNFSRSSSRRHRFPSSEVSQHHPLPIPPFERQIRTYQTQTARGYGDPTDAGDCPPDSGGHGCGI
jgi:hypothetical protein